MQKEKLIDLSGWNEVESYRKILESGIKYVILKAINKSLNPDKKFEQHMKGCADAGIKVIGTYHYSYATTVAKAKEAARAWIKTVNGRYNMFFLDWEDASLPKASRAVDIINAYADEIHKAGHEIAIYTGLSLYNNYLKPYASKLPYDFWIARYYAGYKEFTVNDEVNEKYMPKIAHNLMGWQYTSSGKFPGIKGSVDINLWYKDIVLGNTHSDVITIDKNPFTEPTTNVKVGNTGNDANWVLWYLWRFGKLTDSKGQPDTTKINGIFDNNTEQKVKEVQAVLGLDPDGIVGKITRAVWKKIC